MLNEIITFVESSSTIGQSQVGGQYRSSFIHQVNSQNAGFLKAKIIEDTWNGYELWLKAEIVADPVLIRKELKQLILRNPQDQQRPEGKSTDKKPERLNQPSEQSVRPMQSILPPQQNTMTIYPGYLIATKFSNVLTLIQPIRMQLTMHFQNGGKWPDKLSQIGMSPGDTTDGLYIDSIQLGDNGEMIISLSKEFGDDKLIILSPTLIMGGTNLRWQCQTNQKLTTGNFNCKHKANLSN